jgi:uncharacterized membrane protein
MGQSPQAPASGGGGGGLEPNIAAVLGYFFWPLAIVWLVVDPYKSDRFVRFHSFQTLGLVVTMIALSIVATIGMTILMFIPYIGPIIGLLIWPVVILGMFILWIFLMYKAYNKEMWKIPVIGNFAEKQAG